MPPPDTTVTDPSPGQPRPNGARRRLLLAATGAMPSVLTLSSGAALAANSTITQCLMTPPSNPPEAFSPVDDNWLRAQVKVGQFNNQRAYCVTSPMNACVTPDYHANPGSTWVVDGQTVTAGINNDIRVLSDRAYGLVYVNQQGSIMSLNRATSLDMVPVSDSCWGSLLGNRSLHLG